MSHLTHKVWESIDCAESAESASIYVKGLLAFRSIDLSSLGECFTAFGMALKKVGEDFSKTSENLTVSYRELLPLGNAKRAESHLS